MMTISQRFCQPTASTAIPCSSRKGIGSIRIAVDGSYLYLGSANFTGAGIGAKEDGRRNFGLGIVTDDDVLLDAAQLRFDRIWSGRECGACRLRSSCPNPLDQVEGGHERSNSSKRYSTSRRTSAC
jgi:hypothetical protein